ncbi:3-oxoacyl-[acyl-carrier-protein] synthase III C-terminal domain-containing protein [Allorhizocola rhizosphaerae]|uniref:3-oxoacyl-[acyl-carrier-protein] synthase III C-terminal domain-containing protein n=1 Tax=Allorhizocola rhizosphaerae TaxID=1872709 RepID=UPI000E3DCE96|nr:3-oxoacyl-[acyl-carrier-protein] synthase III C-terminal domain-containing protein [Allorhizocola rhizosphaerae]
MTALASVGCYLPELGVDVRAIGKAAGADDKTVWKFGKLFGLDTVRRAPEHDMRGIMAGAVRALPGLRGNESRVRYVIGARTMSTAVRADRYPMEEVCQEFGMTNAVAFTLGQHGCATGLLGVYLAGQLLAADADPDGLALVLTGEKTHPVIQMIPESAVMGESTAACLVSASGEHDRLLGYATRTCGQWTSVPPDPLDADFLKEHNELLADVMREATDAAGVGLDDVAIILPHNVNRLTWSWTCRVLDLPLERVYLDNIPVTGHCFAADPFINLVHARDAGRLRRGDTYLMAAVGLGATFSAAVLRH